MAYNASKNCNIKKILDEYITLNYVKQKRNHRVMRDSSLNMIEDECMPRYMASAHDFHRSIDNLLDHVDDTFQERMFYYIDTKGLDEVNVYNKAHIDRRLFSKIRSDKHFRPSKKTAICLCFGLELNIDEALDLLARAGFTLSNSSRSDLIVRYFLENKEYDLSILNQILYEYGLSLLYI